MTIAGYVFQEDVFAPGGLVNSGRMPAQIFLLNMSNGFNAWVETYDLAFSKCRFYYKENGGYQLS